MTGKNIIETYNLRRRFGAVNAVAGLDLQAPAGCVYGFLGPNGAGKTTTIRMLLGLIRPDEGEVRLFGHSLADRRREALRRVGALVENPSIYPHLTGRENLEITRRLRGVPCQGIERALGIVGLEQAADRRVGEYSLGMRQRLGLALALLDEAELLILDEPTNGLDPAGIREMRDLIRSLADEHGKTVFLSSHLLGEVEQVATHLGIIHQGRLLFQGKLSELQAQLHKHVSLGVDRSLHAGQILVEAGWRLLPGNNGSLQVEAREVSEAACINARLVAAGIQVHHLSLEQPSLEQIFLKLTEGSPSSIQLPEEMTRVDERSLA